MTNKYFLDESGNTGDLVKLPADINFANQPFFSLSCVKVESCEDLNEYIEALKKKHKVQGDELKSKNLYKSKPKFIIDLFHYIKKENIPFYVEVVDKKYCITTSIVDHQIVPPYFQQFDNEQQAIGFRSELADYLAEHLPLKCYDAFFEACIDKSESKLLNSMKELRNYFRSKECTFQYKSKALNCVQETIKFYHNKKSSKADLVKNLIPIPDISKKGSDIHLLPHVHCWFNIMAKVNKHHKGDMSDVAFFHDQQDHFDDILVYCTEQVRNFSGENQFDPTTDFNIKDEISIHFPDSKKVSGVQLADVLAGFMSRYVMDFIYNDDVIDDVYHDVFAKLLESYNPKVNNFSVNFVLPISRRNKLFKKFKL
ncbi:DUF3800 domain-containing protein [Vibrio parahaemolyticus]|nr:DUF3800 domain-containing protein [Vibrio parahaemolyticus]